MAVEFLENLSPKIRDKVLYNIKKAQYMHDNELFKKVSDNIWEFRTQYLGMAYRLFAFWDKNQGISRLVIATHGIIKKAQKTPKKEIGKAEAIRRQYLDNTKENK